METASRQRPGLFICADELKVVKERAARDPGVARNLEKLTADAARWLKAPTAPPEKGGGFYHDPNSDYRVTVEHYRCSEAARDLALLAWITGDEAYAVPARKILLAYARNYTSFAVHDKEGRTTGRMIAPGRATAQAINEAKWAIPLAWAYDLLYDRFDDGERDGIEQGLFHPAARLIMSNDEGRHNHQSWYNAGVGVIGFLLGERDYVAYALHKPDSGFHAQMQASLTPDGFWYEGSGHYHFFALESLIYLAEAAAHAGVSLYDDRLRSMFHFPLRLADPKMRLPRINDGRQVALTDADRLALYEVAYRRYGDPEFAELLARGRRTSLWFLLFGEKAELPARRRSRTGETLPCGLVTLRKGEQDRASYAVFNLMPDAGGHSHPDKLSFVYFARGRTQAPDSGSIRYRDPLHLKWFKHTVAHNTVTSDLRPQIPAPAAKLVGVAHTPQVDMARGQTSEAYPGVLADRSLVMTEDYILDIFRLVSDEFHWWDWAYRNFGRLEPPAKADAAPPGDRVPGYDEVSLVGSLSTGKDWACRWDLGDGGYVDLQMAPGGRTTVYFGKAPIASYTERDAVDERPIDMVIARRRSNQTLYATLIQATPPGAAAVGAYSLRRLDDAESVDGAALAVDGPGGATDVVLIGYGDEPYTHDGRRVKGGPVWLSVRDAAVRHICTCGPAEICGEEIGRIPEVT